MQDAKREEQKHRAKFKYGSIFNINMSFFYWNWKWKLFCRQQAMVLSGTRNTCPPQPRGSGNFKQAGGIWNFFNALCRKVTRNSQNFEEFFLTTD